MAQIGDSDDSVNTELNLVPFIDLMCVCITFLLITAVWTQVSMIQLGTSVYGQRTEGAVPVPPKQDIVAFRLDVKPGGYIINIGLQTIRIQKVNKDYDDKTLIEELTKIKETYPEKNDAVISIADILSYEMMIRGMDNLIAAGFTDIGIATGEIR